jgi:hypothetical protein
MPLLEFISNYLVPNLDIFIKCLIVSSIMLGLVYLFIKISKWEIFIYLFAMFGTIFSTALILFMNQKHLVETNIVINYFETTFIYLFVIVLTSNSLKKQYRIECRRNYRSTEYSNKNNLGYVRFVTKVCLWCYLFSFVLNVLVFGLHHVGNQVGGGSGLITIISGIAGIILRFSVYILFFHGKKKDRIYLYLYLLLFFGFMFTGISKSAVLGLFLDLCLYMFLDPNNNKGQKFVRKYGPWLIGLSIGFALILIGLMTGNFASAFIVLVQRFIAFGDIYIYAYINNNISKVSGFSFLHYLANDSLRTFRLASNDYAIKVQWDVMCLAYGTTNLTGGPNSRFNVLGYIGFGAYGNLLFAFFCGFIMFIARYSVIKAVNKPFKVQLVILFAFSFIENIAQDSLMLPQFFTRFVIFCFFLLVIDVIYYGCKEKSIC